MTTNVSAISLRGSPMWGYISTYCSVYKKGSPKAALEYIGSNEVPAQLKRQVRTMGDQLIEYNIEP